MNDCLNSRPSLSAHVIGGFTNGLLALHDDLSKACYRTWCCRPSVGVPGSWLSFNTEPLPPTILWATVQSHAARFPHPSATSAAAHTFLILFFFPPHFCLFGSQMIRANTSAGIAAPGCSNEHYPVVTEPLMWRSLKCPPGPSVVHLSGLGSVK